MARVVQRRVRKRGFWGWMFLSLFVVWNLIMGAVFIAALSQPSPAPYSAAAQLARQPGYAAGQGLAYVMIIVAWIAGDLVLGLPAMLAGRKTVVTDE